MISVLMCCYSRQEQLNKTIDRWVNQVGVEYEIIIVHGPNIKLPKHERIVPIEYTGEWNICRGYNIALSKARGNLLLITQCDMLPENEHLILTMVKEYQPGTMVKDTYFPFLHLCLVSTEAVIITGGWCEQFGEFYGFEDTDLTETLLEQGTKNHIIPLGVIHLCHEKPEFTDEAREKYRMSRELFKMRHNGQNH